MNSVTMRVVLALAVLGLVAGSAGQARAGLIVNGGFETGDFTGWTLLPDVGGGVYTRVIANGTYGTSGLLLPHQGTYFATFSNYASQGDSGIEQTVTTTPGQVYTLSYWFSNNPGSTPPDELLVKVEFHSRRRPDQLC